MRNCGQQRSISTAIIVRSRNSLHPQWVVRYFFYRKRNGMPEISRIFWEISSYNGKIFLTKNMLFTLCLKPLRRNLILGKQNNTRGLCRAVRSGGHGRRPFCFENKQLSDWKVCPHNVLRTDV